MKKTVLLVEDDDVVREMIRGALERDFRILEASRYAGAVDQLKKPLDIALVDYYLPDRNGFEVLSAVRDSWPALPVIMMTGYSRKDLVITLK